MKKLEELGISPAPLDIAEPTGLTATVVSVVNDDVCMEIASCSENDARLIAAAPELYEAVSDLLEIVGNVSEYIGVDCGTMGKVEKAKAALAKAAGESEGASELRGGEPASTQPAQPVRPPDVQGDVDLRMQSLTALPFHPENGGGNFYRECNPGLMQQQIDAYKAFLKAGGNDPAHIDETGHYCAKARESEVAE